MYKDLLPLGSVINLKESDDSIMICGRLMVRTGEDKLYDYTGVPYPVGLSDPGNMLFFDDDAIESIEFIGCQNAIEKEFRDKMLAPLDEAKDIRVVNGEIIVE